ncbi:ParB/RepB/Spo0J family partition protein [Dietzia lutea]|uniref:ParB-like N-terminal domain-containing protein n=1 Tax=Dietzia lutea TaxID=546160 RepID=A0A2S1R812_9ACTN|nr:ParB/RepB/Spo0J family partition protein [Dietzia lutea]AWH92436.1 hypothetical protein A6035_09975 [Dietzia lutea]
MAKSYEYKLPDHKVEYGVKVPTDELKIDPQAQRTLNEKRAQKLADTFIPEAVGTIIVSERESGEKYIVDGQHRWRASQLLERQHVICEVHKGLTQTEEAILFLIKNRESSRPSAIDEYHIGLTGGIPLFVDTDKVVTKHKLSMGSTSVNAIGAVNGVLRITDRYGAETLDRTLAVAEEAWGRTAETWDGMLLGGLGEFIGRHGEQITSDDELAKKLGKRNPAWKWKADVHARSTSGGTQHSGTGGRVMTCYHMIVETWNKGRRSETTKIVL